MPLIKSCDIEAFRKNIAAEIEAGRPRDQAVAIAADTLRKACKAEGKAVPKMDGKEFVNVARYDFGQVESVERLDNGFLRCPGRITRTGVFVYHDKDGKEFRELRLPDEVFKADALRSFVLAPLTNDHPPVDLDAKNTGKYQVGTIGEPRQDGEFVSATIQITDERAVKDVEEGKRELSCGYRADLDFTPGVTAGIDGVPDGLRYDAIQRNIQGNHVAIVAKGRAGSTASLRLDSGDAVLSHAVSDGLEHNPDRGIERTSRMKIKLDGIPLDLDESAAEIVNKAIERRDSEIKNLKTDAETKAEEFSKEKARADKATEDLEDLQKRHDAATDPENVKKAISDRLTLEREAAKVLGEKKEDGEEWKLDDMADDEIKKAVILKISPKAAEKLDGAEAAYIAARYDQAVEGFDPEKVTKNDSLDRTLIAANQSQPKTDADDARSKMIKRNFELGRKPIGEANKEKN